MTANNQPMHQVNIQLGEKEAEGTYANLAIISHSPAEFIIDFTRVLPGVPKTKVYSRIIMTPQHAKALSKALQENLNKYEAQFGEIKVINEPAKTQPIGFQASTDAHSNDQD
ncbi:DUF3467 domain-containing protein [candidate division KSB1 bacterium]|nr:DUF3467 domain-containing protein [candidate division KSB1 bacterium]